MKKLAALVAVLCVFISVIVGCSSSAPASSTSSSSSSSSSISTKSSSSSSKSISTSTSSSASASTAAPEAKTVLQRCAQDYFDIEDVLTDAIFANNTSKIDEYIKTLNTDLEKLNALTDIPEEYQAATEHMKECLSQYGQCLSLYRQGAEVVNKDDATADKFFDEGEPYSVAAYDAYKAYLDATAGLISEPTKQKTQTTSSNTGKSGTSSSAKSGTSTGTTTKYGVDATKKYKQGDRTDRLTGTVTKKTSDTYWVDGDDGIEYKCWPHDKADLEFFAPGNKIEFSGTVRSTSQLSCNLENALWFGTK